jgi:ribA/ribD-fused uncharacterized protein
MEKILYTDIGPTGKKYEKGDWKEFAIHNEKEIKGFFGEYRFLSNFGKARVFLDNVEYPRVENAYQAAKRNINDREGFVECTGLESIEKNKDFGLDKDWHERKYEVMKDLLYQKFNSELNSKNVELLLETGNMYLEEMNWWGDTYWGTNKNSGGENMLGKLLMEIRESLK